jgi:hypothetical protein
VGLCNSWQPASVDEKHQRGEKLVETILLPGVKPHRGNRFFSLHSPIYSIAPMGLCSILIPGFYQSAASMRLESQSLKGWYDYRKIIC